jgi:plasmid stability protein
MRLATRTARWLRIIASRQDTSVSAVCRDLRTAAALAREVVRVLDSLARDEARALFAEKRPKPLPADADWLTRHHYNEIKRERDAVVAKEQEQAWERMAALQQGK